MKGVITIVAILAGGGFVLQPIAEGRESRGHSKWKASASTPKSQLRYRTPQHGKHFERHRPHRTAHYTSNRSWNRWQNQRQWNYYNQRPRRYYNWGNVRRENPSTSQWARYYFRPSAYYPTASTWGSAAYGGAYYTSRAAPTATVVYETQPVVEVLEPVAGSVEVGVQVALQRLGFYEGPIDGVIGQGTRRAIRQYRSQAGLPVTGTIDRDLLGSLGFSGVF